MDRSGQVRLWDGGAGVCLHTLEAGRGGGGIYWSDRNNIDFSPDGGLLACTGPEVHIWQVDSGHLEAKIKEEGRMVAWSKGEGRLAVVMGEQRGEVRLYDV